MDTAGQRIVVAQTFQGVVVVVRRVQSMTGQGCEIVEHALAVGLPPLRAGPDGCITGPVICAHQGVAIAQGHASRAGAAARAQCLNFQLHVAYKAGLSVAIAGLCAAGQQQAA